MLTACFFLDVFPLGQPSRMPRRECHDIGNLLHVSRAAGTASSLQGLEPFSIAAAAATATGLTGAVTATSPTAVMLACSCLATPAHSGRRAESRTCTRLKAAKFSALPRNRKHKLRYLGTSTSRASEPKRVTGSGP